MSEKTPSQDSKSPAKSGASNESAKNSAPLTDLSSLNFGPAWAKEKPKKERQNSEYSKSTGESPRRSKPEGREGDQRGNRGYKKQGHGEQSGRRQGQRGPRRDQRGQREVVNQVVVPEGVSVRIMPIEEGLDALAKQISDTGRTHSVFDLAWIILGGLDRFHVIFESDEKFLHRSLSDRSLWTSQKECLNHFWLSGTVGKYYDEELIEVAPPTGNFQSIARCGLSKKLIGPPNHHAYQQTLLELHREKFSNMSLEAYKARVIIEQGEESVDEWLESMKSRTVWRPKEMVKEPTEAPTATESEDANKEVSEEKSAPIPATADEPVVVLNDRRELEQHFIANFLESEYESGKTMSVLGNISDKLINPGLLKLQKERITELRRYPGDLASILCRQMSGRNLAVYKWKKRLHCGPARPKHLPEDLVMADRPAALFKWASEHPVGEIDDMWKALFPADIDDESKSLWYHDLRWLIHEGYVILLSNGTLHAAKERAKPAGKKAAKKNKKAPVPDQKAPDQTDLP